MYRTPSTLPDSVYEAYARGELSEAEVCELEKFAETLVTKEALAIPASLQEDIMRTALNAGVLTASAGGLALAGKGLASMASSLTFKRDLNRILEVHPDLRDHPEKDLHLAYNSIRTLNPEFAKDPLVGGQLLGQILRNRPPDNPKAAPRVDLGTAKDLVAARAGKRPAYMQELLGTLGVEAAKQTIGERGRVRNGEDAERRNAARVTAEEDALRIRGQQAMQFLQAQAAIDPSAFDETKQRIEAEKSHLRAATYSRR